MKINTGRILAVTSSIIIALYLLVFILDLADPKYLGVQSLTNLLIFRKGVSIIPAPPSLLNGWRDYMGTTYYSILLFPALLGSLKFDFIIMFASLAISASVGIGTGVSAVVIGGRYKKIIIYVMKIISSAPYILIILLILYIVRPLETGIIIALSAGWFPFYVLRSLNVFENRLKNKERYTNKRLLFNFLQYFFADMGAITGVVTIITYFGFYFYNPLNIDIGNIMYLNGYVNIFLLSGVWWIIIFPLVFITVFISFTALLSYELGGNDDARI